MNRAFVFSTTAFLMIIPAAILAASFLHVVKTGDDATALSMKADVTLYTYKNVRAGFNKASCSYFLLSGSDTSAIIGNLSDEWSTQLEANYTGINITIDKTKINVTYDSGENSIRVGNINDINDGIPINITYQNTTIEGKLGPLEIQANCDVVIPGEDGDVDDTPFITLFLRSSNLLDLDEGASPDSTKEPLAEGNSISFTISPLYSDNQFNVTGNIDIYLYLDAIPDGTKYPKITINLTCGDCYPDVVVAALESNLISNDTAQWYIMTITPTLGTIIPKGSNLTLTITAEPVSGGNPTLDLFYDSAAYNSAINIPGNASAPDETAPTFAGLSSATNKDTGGAVDLYWAPASDASTPITYYVYISSTGMPDTSLTENYTTTNNYINITGLTNNQWYNFVVRAKDAASNFDSNSPPPNESATPTGNTTSETLISTGSLPGSNDSFDFRPLEKSDTKEVIVDELEVELIGFEDPSAASVNQITSCKIYWVDQVNVLIGPPTTINRTIEMGDGSSWDWGSFGPSEATGSKATYELDISSYFDNVSVNDATAINDIQLRYTSLGTSGDVELWWDQVYIDINYSSI